MLVTAWESRWLPGYSKYQATKLSATASRFVRAWHASHISDQKTVAKCS